MTGHDPEIPSAPGPRQEGKPLSPEPGSSTAEGISTGLKRGILILTVFTFVAFTVFAALLFKTLTGSTGESARWDDEILTVADRLRDAGLKDQALRLYEHYLENPRLEFEKRGRVAYTTGSLYLELDNCAEGLVWLYQAQIAYPGAPWAVELSGKIDACLARLKTTPSQ